MLAARSSQWLESRSWDDSQLSRRYHATCLRRHGFKPVEIIPGDLSDALKALKAAAPDALLVDFLMPGFRGDALIRALRGSDSPALQKLPILLVTAHTPDDAIAPSLQGLRVELLQKPIDNELIIYKVRKIVPLKKGI